MDRHLIELAARVAARGQHNRGFFVGAAARRNDGATVSAFNGRTPKPDRCCHAEYRLRAKLDVGSVVYVARVMRSGELAMARPCKDCEKALKSRGVKRVYYTIGPAEFGRMDLGR